MKRKEYRKGKRSVEIINMRMKLLVGISVGFLWFLLGVCAWAGEDSTDEDLLEVLRKNRTITREQYESLKKKERAKPGKLSNGLRFESRDKRFKYMIGGRIQTDFAFYDSNRTFRSNFSEPNSGAEFRRARFFISGLLYNRVKFKAQYDFAGQTGFTDVKDLYLGLIKLPVVGNFNVGHFKEPFSLEEMTSSKYDTFMEDSLMNAFAPGRNVGAAFYDFAFNHHATWAIGVFRPTRTNLSLTENDDGYNITFRVTGLPIKKAKGKKLAHVGFGYSFSDSREFEFRFLSKPESNLARRFVDTGIFSQKRCTGSGGRPRWYLIHSVFRENTH